MKPARASMKITAKLAALLAAGFLAAFAASPAARAQNAAAADLPSAVVWSADLTTLTWAWTPAANAGQLLHYRIRWTTPGAGTWLNPSGINGLVVPGGTAATGIRLAQLIPNTGYDIELGSSKMVSGAEVTRWSGTAIRANTGVGTPPRVSGLHLKPMNGKIEVNWLGGFTSSATQQQPDGYAVRWARGAGSTDWINPGGEFGVRIPASAGVSIADRRDHVISGLTNGQTYAVQIAGYNRRGLGEWSDSVESMPYTNPATPVMSLQPRLNKMVLNWTLANNGGAPIIGVVYRWRLVSGPGLSVADTANWHSGGGGADGTFIRIQGGNSLTITGIDGRHVVRYQMRVVNAQNLQSEWSNAIQSTAGSRGQSQNAPGAPTLQFAQQRNRQVMFHFTPPADPALEILGYEFRVFDPPRLGLPSGAYLNPGARAERSADGRSVRLAHSFLVTDLPTERGTQTQVRAFNEAKTGVWSNSLTTSARPRTVVPEGAPRLTSFTSTHNTMTLRWFPPTYDGGSTIFQYEWELTESGNTHTGTYNIPGVKQSDMWAASTGSPLVFDNSTASGLTITPGTQYTVRIRPRNSSGWGVWSATATTTPPQPTTPELIPPANFPGNFAVAFGGDANFDLTWTQPPNAAKAQISNYLVRWRVLPNGEFTNEGGEDGVRLPATARAYTIPAGALQYGAFYSVQLAAEGPGGRSDYSAWEITLATTPEAPQDVILTQRPGTVPSLLVQWSKPFERGDGISGYDVRVRTSAVGDTAAGAWEAPVTITGTPAPTEYIYSGLAGTTKYDAQVRASNGIGDSEWSRIAQESTLAANAASVPVTLPGIPRFLSVTQAEGRKLKVNWQAPERAGGERIGNYRVRWSDDDDVKGGSDNTWEGPGGEDGVALGSVALTEGLIGPLELDTEYEVQVAAMHRGASGAVSEWTTSVSATPRRSAETALLSLRPSTGTISPNFDAETTEYTMEVGSEVERMRFTAEAKGQFASFTIGKTGGQRWMGRNNIASRDFTLSSGENVFAVVVTADDGETTRAYQVTVTRAMLPLLTPIQPRVRFHADGNVASEVVLPRAYGAVGRVSHLLEGVPTYLAYTPNTRRLATAAAPDGPPTVSELTEIKLTYKVRDSARPPRESSYEFPLSLAPPPVLSEAAPAAMTLTINTALRAELPALTLGFAPYTYVLEGELPAGLEFDGETRMLTGTPTTAETKSLFYRAVDLLGARGAASGTVRSPLEVIVERALPPTVEDLAARPINEGLRISWTPLARNDITEYRIRWQRDGAVDSWRNASGVDAECNDTNMENDNMCGEMLAFDAASYTITGLNNNMNYDVEVAAVNNVGIGSWAAIESTPTDVLTFVEPQEEVVLALGIPLSQPVTLPQARGGSAPISYALADPDGNLNKLLIGLDFDAETRQLSGTPGDNSGDASMVPYTLSELPVTVAATFTAEDASTPDTVKDELVFNIRLVSFDLDLDTADTDTEAAANARDGIITARYLLGVRGASLLHGQSAGNVAAHESALKDGVDSTALDVDGDGDADGDDGILIARHIFGLRGDELFAGFSITDEAERAKVEANITRLLPGG